jgi:hypothetical protein
VNKEFLESFRLNLDEFSGKDVKEFMSYQKLSQNKKLNQVGIWLKA